MFHHRAAEYVGKDDRDDDVDGVVALDDIGEGDLIFWCVGAVLNLKQLKEVCQLEHIESSTWSKRLRSIERGSTQKNFFTYYTGWQTFLNINNAEPGEEANVRYELFIDRQSDETMFERSFLYFYAVRAIPRGEMLVCIF